MTLRLALVSFLLSFYSTEVPWSQRFVSLTMLCWGLWLILEGLFDKEQKAQS